MRSRLLEPEGEVLEPGAMGFEDDAGDIADQREKVRVGDGLLGSMTLSSEVMAARCSNCVACFPGECFFERVQVDPSCACRGI